MAGSSRTRITLAAAGAAVVIGGIAAGVALGSTPGAGKPAPYRTPSGHVAAGADNTIIPPAAPSPSATYQGACSYNLGDNPVGGTAVATGDIEVTNTGNIGVTLTLTITWPQQGYNPLTQTKTGVQVAAGQASDIQFNLPMNESQLTNLQNWQTGHGFADGCTYNGTITGTYGSVS